MNLQNADHWRRLVAGVRESRRKLRPFREKRTELINAFVGSEYTSEKMVGSRKVYLSLLTMAANIYVRQLAVRAPTARVTTPISELRPQAKNFSLACDEAARETNLGVILRRAVTDSLFSNKAILKVGLESTGSKEMYGESIDMTDPFIRKISFDDYVVDMSARSANLPGFEGDIYYMPVEKFKEMYSGKLNNRDVTADELSMQGEEGEERAESISHRQTSGDDNFKHLVALQDVYLPELNQMATYMVNSPEKALNIIYFDSPENCVYHSLWYTNVPDNAMPLQPFSILKNIHEFANSLLRRIVSQARKQKRLVAFSDEESANIFSAAKDGDGVNYTGQKPESLESGGIDQMMVGTFAATRDLFSWTAGNLDSLGGLSPMADTLGQDELMAQSAGAQLRDMQDAVTGFAKKVFRQIAWYEWTDPIRERTLQKEIHLPGEYIPVQWTPDTRIGNFLDFNFDILPYSMREDAPGNKLSKLQAILANIYAPLAPYMQQQGKTVDVDRLNELVSDWANLPELEQIIVAMDPSMMEQEGGPQGNPQPAVVNPNKPNGNYTRRSIPGASRAGKDDVLMRTGMGAKVQGSEAAAMNRPVG